LIASLGGTSAAQQLRSLNQPSEDYLPALQRKVRQGLIRVRNNLVYGNTLPFYTVLAVATMELDRPGSIAFVKKHPEYKFTFLFDPYGPDEASLIKKAIGITALPTNLLVDANGKIVSAYRGERKEAEWTEMIDKLVAK
jgi:hypothetical protein